MSSFPIWEWHAVYLTFDWWNIYSKFMKCIVLFWHFDFGSSFRHRYRKGFCFGFSSFCRKQSRDIKRTNKTEVRCSVFVILGFYTLAGRLIPNSYLEMFASLDCYAHILFCPRINFLHFSSACNPLLNICIFLESTCLAVGSVTGIPLFWMENRKQVNISQLS